MAANPCDIAQQATVTHEERRLLGIITNRSVCQRLPTSANRILMRDEWSGTASNYPPSAFQGGRGPASQPLAEISIADASSSLPDCLRRVHPCQGKPLCGRFASLGTANAGPRDGSYRGGRERSRAGDGAGQTTVRRAISVLLTSVKRVSRGCSRTVHTAGQYA
jgi:hypothetical protein